VKFTRTFIPLIENQDRYLVLVGGGGSGKSGFASRKLAIRGRKQGGHRFLVVRKVQRACRESCRFLMEQVLAESNFPYQYLKAESKIIFNDVNGVPNEVIFGGLDDREKIKSIQGITSIWMEEATEFEKDDFLQLDLRLRDPTPDYRQIMMTFNPDESQAPWLKDIFFGGDTPVTGPKKKPDSYIHHSTYLDNPNEQVRLDYRTILDNLGDETYDKIYRLGLWAAVKGRIYTKWDEQEPPTDVDDVFFGLDFGFSVDPSAFVKIYRKADEYWIRQLIYETKLTGGDLADKIKGLGREVYDPDTAIIYADSENPMAIEEMCRAGLLVKPAIKGQGSVRAGIDFIKNKCVHLTPDSIDLIKECKGYKYKEDARGDPIPEPVKYKDHGMDALRYGIYTDAIQGAGDMELIVL
jgi:phage terminase large subunit